LEEKGLNGKRLLISSFNEYDLSWAYPTIGFGDYKCFEGLKNEDGQLITKLLHTKILYQLAKIHEQRLNATEVEESGSEDGLQDLGCVTVQAPQRDGEAYDVRPGGDLPPSPVATGIQVVPGAYDGMNTIRRAISIDLLRDASLAEEQRQTQQPERRVQEEQATILAKEQRHIRKGDGKQEGERHRLLEDNALRAQSDALKRGLRELEENNRRFERQKQEAAEEFKRLDADLERRRSDVEGKNRQVEIERQRSKDERDRHVKKAQEAMEDARKWREGLAEESRRTQIERRNLEIEREELRQQQLKSQREQHRASEDLQKIRDDLINDARRLANNERRLEERRLDAENESMRVKTQ